MLSLLLLPLAVASGGEPTRLNVYTEQFYPFNYTINGTIDEEIKGYSTELVQAILAEAELEYEIHIVPWIRALRALDRAENVLVFSMFRTPEREADYTWVAPLFSMDFHLYGLRENLPDLPRTLKDAEDFRIGIVRGDVLEEYFEKLDIIELVLVNDYANNFPMLFRGRIDLYAEANLAAGPLAQNSGYNPDELVGVVDLEFNSDLYLVASKYTDPALLQRIQIAYESLQTSGVYSQLLQRMMKEVEEISIELLSE